MAARAQVIFEGVDGGFDDQMDHVESRLDRSGGGGGGVGMSFGGMANVTGGMLAANAIMAFGDSLFEAAKRNDVLSEAMDEGKASVEGFMDAVASGLEGITPIFDLLTYAISELTDALVFAQTEARGFGARMGEMLVPADTAPTGRESMTMTYTDQEKWDRARQAVRDDQRNANSESFFSGIFGEVDKQATIDETNELYHGFSKPENQAWAYNKLKGGLGSLGGLFGSTLGQLGGGLADGLTNVNNAMDPFDISDANPMAPFAKFAAGLKMPDNEKFQSRMLGGESFYSKIQTDAASTNDANLEANEKAAEMLEDIVKKGVKLKDGLTALFS